MRKLLVFLFFCGMLCADEPQKKIIYLTVPKAGTHLLKKTIEMLTGQNSRWIGLAETANFNAAIALRLPAHIIGGHLFPEMDKIRTVYGDKYIKILMIRDPRDVMLSFMHHLRKNMVWSGCPTFDYDRFVTLPFEDQLRETFRFPYDYRNPACTFAYAALWMKDPTVFVCRFEDLVGEKGGGSNAKQREVVRALAALLKVEKTDAEIEELCENLYGGTWTFREGQIGQWKKAYSEENLRLFNELMGNAVQDLGYEVE